jgi:hypothetical protein
MPTQNSFERGPFITAALFCEKLLQETDGVKSAIRIVDRVIIQTEGPQPPNEMPSFNLQTTLFLQFKSGAARGPLQLEVRMVKPSVDTKSILSRTVLFEGEDDRGTDIICYLNLKVDQSGIYWFYVYLDDVIVTRLPLRIIYLKQIRQISTPSTGNP